MGTGASVPAEGVKANPRLVYADQLSKKNKKQNYKLDAPVLIDVGHGSIRYRYEKVNTDPNNKSKRIEKPYEGTEAGMKKDYFYHPRLNDFSEKASADKEEDHKFMYVVKGPNSCKQKKIFYVYGKGWSAKDGTVIKPTDSKAAQPDPTWPQRLNPNDLYYNCILIDEAPVPGSEDEEPLVSDDGHSLRFTLRDNETVDEVKRKIAHRVIRSAAHIHVCFNYKELRGSDIIGDLREGDAIKEDFFCVKLSLMQH